MLSPQFSSDLINPLSLRARGNRSSQFFDRAASLLASQLELDTLQALNSSEKAALQRSEWIDQKVLSFLQKHPNALGVELNAGVSTRFHRLSSTLDWPQFRWADINTPETHAFSQSLLPITDNYRSIGCDMYQDDWLFRAGWQPGLPLIIITESHTEYSDLAQLITELSQRAAASGAPVMVVTTHQGNFAGLVQQLTFFELVEQCEFQSVSLLACLARIAAKIGLNLPVNQWHAMHLELSANDKTAQD